MRERNRATQKKNPKKKLGAAALKFGISLGDSRGVATATLILRSAAACLLSVTPSPRPGAAPSKIKRTQGSKNWR